MSRGGKTALGAALFVVAVAIVGGRIWSRLDGVGPPFSTDAALVDFRDAVYYPVVALLAGENPYDRTPMLARHPVNGTIGLYSPLTLLLHLPWGLLPYRTAEFVFVLGSFVLVLVLAVVAWRVRGRRVEPGLVLGFAAVLVITRPGHWNLFLGQVALETALATLAALWLARSHPWLAGLGFAVTTFKATYGVPLLVLMAVLGNWRALGIGLVSAALLTIGPLGVVVARAGAAGFVGSVLGNYEARVTTPRMSAAHSPFRVDVVALVGRVRGDAPGMLLTLALSAAVLALAAVALRPLADRSDLPSRQLGLAIASLAILLCTYHQQYDLVLLAPLLLTALPLHPWRREQVPAFLVAIPFVNYLASGFAQRMAGTSTATVLLLSSVNGVALLAALALLVAQARDGRATR